MNIGRKLVALIHPLGKLLDYRRVQASRVVASCRNPGRHCRHQLVSEAPVILKEINISLFRLIESI